MDALLKSYTYEIDVRTSEEELSEASDVDLSGRLSPNLKQPEKGGATSSSLHVYVGKIDRTLLELSNVKENNINQKEIEELNHSFDDGSFDEESESDTHRSLPLHVSSTTSNLEKSASVDDKSPDFTYTDDRKCLDTQSRAWKKSSNCDSIVGSQEKDTPFDKLYFNPGLRQSLLTCCNIHCPTVSKRYKYSRSKGKEALPFLCEFCGRLYSHRKILMQHVWVMHRKYRSHKCETCGKFFTTEKTLLDHRKRPHKTFPCQECGKVLKSVIRLKDHEDRIHKKLRKFKCCVCGKHFSSNRKIRNHMIVIHNIGEKRFQCELCDNAYSQKTLYDYHVQATHSENKSPFKCHDCGLSYTSKYTMLNHVKRVHNLKDVHYCNSCKQGFTGKDLLQNHDCVDAATPRTATPPSNSKKRKSFNQDKEPDCEDVGDSIISKVTLGNRDINHAPNIIDNHKNRVIKKKSYKKIPL